VLCFTVLGFWLQSAHAQDGKLKVEASPSEAYVFVDGKAMHEASGGAITLPAGQHEVGIYNYGFSPVTRTVTIDPGMTSTLEVTLAPVSQSISKPWGAMTIEGPSDAAVLLNGKTPDYFVGAVDEFNHNWWWKQELVVPPGTHQVTIMQGDQTVWSGAVPVAANQRVVIDANRGQIKKTEPWPRGDQLGARPPFRAGAASATVVVAPVTAQFAAAPTPVNCGTPAQLTWSSNGAVRNEITPIGGVASSGSQSVQPNQTTTYTHTASGPGGIVTSNATVVVNTAIQASLQASPTEVRYHRIGDTVDQQASPSISWSVSNASSVSIENVGTVGATGNRSFQLVPQRTGLGPIDETVTYRLSATNACGVTETRTATVRLTGSIDSPPPPPSLALNSIYFPTNFPTMANPQEGLVESQQRVLVDLADSFKKHLERDPQARLILNAHADERGPTTFNQALSERRAEIVRSFLMEHGVPETNIQTQASGSQDNLPVEQVQALETQNPKLSQEERQRLLVDYLRTTVLANNRRVDVAISTSGQQSLRYYPHDVEDAATLWGRNEPANTQAGAASGR
jgi:outer membrane protein OmpA-like peptidoglycan-associated protein